MDLLRHWRRGTFGVAAGALVAPVAILLAALAVGIGGGGLAGLGSLSQALTGPDLPGVEPVAQRRPARDSGRLLARVNRRAAAQARAAASGGGAAGAGATTGAGGTTDQTEGVVDPGGGTTPGGAPPPAATAPPPATPPPAPTPTPESPVRQVGDTVTTVTDQVPVVGPTTSGVVDQVVDTVDALIPPRPR
jgi:hypothetical protein